MIACLLIAAAIAHLLPMSLVQWLGGTNAAWEYVCYGIEATALWLALARFLCFESWPLKWGGLAVCWYGVFESSQRWACRLMLPMDKAPRLPEGVHLCDAAGIPLTAFSAVAIALVAAVVSATSSRLTAN